MYGGLVTAKSTGTAIITATTYNGKKTTCKITIKKAPSTVSFQNKEYTVKVGTTKNLTLKFPTDSTSYKNTYSSSNSKIVSVNKNGKITAKKMGEATVRVKTFNGKENTCKIIVTPEKATSNTYDSMISDLAKVNPNYYNGYEWTVNCQRCVPTYELRRRGYDVTALPNRNITVICRKISFRV